jgi:uncharacterized protein (TIGR02246 family)
MACQPAEEPAEPAPAATTSTEADDEALRELSRQGVAEFNAGNLDGLMALYADDAVQMPPNNPIIIGKDSLRSGFEEFLAANTSELSSTVEDIGVSGGWAFLRLSYTQSITPKDGGDTTLEVGKWVLILERQADDSWRITTEIWNADAASN